MKVCDQKVRKKKILTKEKDEMITHCLLTRLNNMKRKLDKL